MPNNNKAQPEDRVRAQKALDLRLAGMTYSAIAQSLEYADESGARKAVDRCLKQSTAEGVAELREMEGQRLDRMQRAVWVNATRGDLDAIKVCLQVMDRRAKLFGLNAPVALRVAEVMTDEQFAEKMTELIGAMEPDALGELLTGLPGTAGRSLLNAAGPATYTGMDDTLAALAAVSDEQGAETTLPPRPAGWSNIE